MKCQQVGTSWVLYLVCDLVGRSELPYVCGPVVSTAESNSRRFSSFTGRAEYQFVCMRSRNCIIGIIIIIILISCSGRDVSKLPGDGDFFWLVLV